MTTPPAPLAGRCALVTGGSSGIGLATATALHAAGATVAVLDRTGVGPDSPHVGVPADITDAAAVARAVADAVRRLGGLDIVVNNAGIGTQGTIESHDDAEWHRVFDVNVVGLVRVTRAALPALREAVTRHGDAAIVNISSIVATAGLPQRALYSATKGAISALTRAMAADLLPEGVRVNAVTPGTVDTPWIERLLAAADDPAAVRAALEARQPSGRMVTAAEVAAAVVHLASPAAASTTGTELAVDGGMSALRLRPRI